jgi:hypothetical protein
LECNFDKTCIIPVGGIDEIPFEHADINILVTDRVKLLGLDLDKNLTCLQNVHEKTYEKVTAITRFWSRFWLSLPGRINIAKTLCLSQINYLGCIITPPPDILKKIEDCIFTFVKGKMNISKEKMYSPVREGGCGLIDISTFIASQQTIWIKRVFEAGCDNWREEIYNITFGNPAVLHPKMIDKHIHPIIHNIAVSFEKFKMKFFNLNNNYRKSHLFFNPIITRGRRDTALMDHNFFRQMPVIVPEKLVTVQFRQVYSNTPVRLDEINDENGLNLGLNLVLYMRLIEACSNFITTRKQAVGSDDTCLDLKDFLGPLKRDPVVSVRFSGVARRVT